MGSTAPTLLPPLRDGDRLTREEFLLRWEAMPDLKRAELLDGTVHMPSPVSHRHNVFQPLIASWLSFYAAATPGCEVGADGTWLMSPTTVPQPDVTMRILSDRGGQSTIINEYLAGAPELAIEISHSTSARDLGPKANLYLQHGVREYLVVLTKKNAVVWRERAGNRYRRLEADSANILRSHIFPGLWLDLDALLKRDLNGLLETLQQGLATPEHAAFVRRLASPQP